MYALKQKPGKGIDKKVLLGIFGLLIVAAGVFAFLEMTDKVNFFGSKKQAPTIGPQTKGESPNAESSENEGTNEQPNTQETKRGSTNTQSKTLHAPSGNFVSNHEPNLSGKPAPNLIQSVCVTTPGATCTITFTKDGITKSLSTQTADGEGAAYWDWRLQDIGLTTGEWKIQAKATLNGQAKTAEDSLNLRVNP